MVRGSHHPYWEDTRYPVQIVSIGSRGSYPNLMKNQIENKQHPSALSLPPFPNDAKFSYPREPEKFLTEQTFARAKQT